MQFPVTRERARMKGYLGSPTNTVIGEYNCMFEFMFRFTYESQHESK